MATNTTFIKDGLNVAMILWDTLLILCDFTILNLGFTPLLIKLMLRNRGTTDDEEAYEEVTKKVL